MILLDPEDPPSSKSDVVAGSTTLRLPEGATVASSRASSLLPDYETSQAQASTKLDKYALRKRVTKYRVDSRFWRATLYALAIYVALTVAIGVPVIVIKTKQSPPPPTPQFRAAWEGAIPNSGGFNGAKGLFTMDNNTLCDRWQDSRSKRDPDGDDDVERAYSAVMNHFFSQKVDQLVLQSNVSTLPDQSRGIYGNLTVDLNPDPSVSVVSAVLSFSTTSSDLRSRTHACFCDNGTDASLTIYVPDQRGEDDSLLFSLTILFPRHSSSTTVKDFATSLPTFNQRFGDLSSLNFSTFAVQGGQGEISFRSLNAQLLSVKNSFASIRGDFRVTASLNLDNIEGPIDTNVTLVQTPGQDAPIFQLDTGNSPLNAHFMIVSPSSSDKEAGDTDDRPYSQCFSGEAKTFGAPLSLEISYSTSTPAEVPLSLSVMNNQADTNVTLDSKFSGTFDIQTKLATVQLVPADDNVSSKRTVVYDQKIPTRSRGWIGFGKRPSHWDPSQGNVQVVSSLSPIRLQLGSSS